MIIVVGNSTSITTHTKVTKMYSRNGQHIKCSLPVGGYDFIYIVLWRFHFLIIVNEKYLLLPDFCFKVINYELEEFEFYANGFICQHNSQITIPR